MFLVSSMSKASSSRLCFSLAWIDEGLDDVRNSGTVTADEVAQLYLHQQSGTSSRPVRELKGFHRVTVAPGETKFRVTVRSPFSSCRIKFASTSARVFHSGLLIQDKYFPAL